MTEVIKKLLMKFKLNPLYLPQLQRDACNIGPGLSAVQQATRGGYAGIVKVLTSSNTGMVIDKEGRMVADYIITFILPIVKRSFSRKAISLSSLRKTSIRRLGYRMKRCTIFSTDDLVILHIHNILLHSFFQIHS